MIKVVSTESREGLNIGVFMGIILQTITLGWTVYVDVIMGKEAIMLFPLFYILFAVVLNAPLLAWL